LAKSLYSECLDLRIHSVSKLSFDSLLKEVSSLKMRVNNCEIEIQSQAQWLKKIETHPHGTRKDGTPKAKPGRKTREQS
jgi:hypothetical protein